MDHRVVGVHFFPLARLFGRRIYDVLGAVILTCGILGLIAVAVHANDVVVAAIAGEVPGVVLLGAAIFGARPAPHRAGVAEGGRSAARL